MADNIISGTYNLYKKIIPNPLVNAAVLGIGSWFVTKKLGKPLHRLMLQAASAATGKAGDPQVAQQNQRIVQQASAYRDRTLPIIIGSLIAGGSLIGNGSLNKKYYGLTSWNPEPDQASKFLIKTQSFNQPMIYQPSVNMSTQVDVKSVSDIFRTNPILRSDSYARNLGLSIVNAAPNSSFDKVALGSIYDSAVNKFQHKIGFSDVVGQGLKSFAAASLAGMFTDTIGTVMGMPAKVRGPLTKSTALGTALYTILT